MRGDWPGSTTSDNEALYLMKRKIPFSLFAIRYHSLFAIRYSRFAIRYSRFGITLITRAITRAITIKIKVKITTQMPF